MMFGEALSFIFLTASRAVLRDSAVVMAGLSHPDGIRYLHSLR